MTLDSLETDNGWCVQVYGLRIAYLLRFILSIQSVMQSNYQILFESLKLQLDLFYQDTAMERTRVFEKHSADP